jgi:N-acetylmuramoyl-L-alanine amidase
VIVRGQKNAHQLRTRWKARPLAGGGRDWCLLFFAQGKCGARGAERLGFSGHALHSGEQALTKTKAKLTKKIGAIGLAGVLAGMTLLAATGPGEEKHISVYSPAAIYTVPILERAGHEYVGLLELLDPLGRVSSQSNGGVLRLRFNTVDAEFVVGRTRGRIRGKDFDFAAPFLIENSRGLVSVGSLGALLPRFLGTPVNFHESAGRLFVGNVGIQVSFQLDANDPAHLALNFSGPVNPTISTEPGRVRMVFKREPLLSPGSQSIAFDNKIFKQASFSEAGGDAELDVAANEPLIATFSGDRRTINLASVPQNPAARGTPETTGAGQGNPAHGQPAGTAATNAGAASTAPHRIVAVVDAAHGGEERGAALTETLAEKEVTLGFARLLRHELETRGFAVVLLRDSDIGLTLDQRAAATNVAHAGIYITLHAVSQGRGARVYTALLPVEGASKGAFHAWNAAQAGALPVSRIISSAIVGEMQKREIVARASSASLRPLNNVVMPAVAVELAPGEGGIAELSSANYQQRVAAAIGDAVASVRDRLGVTQ